MKSMINRESIAGRVYDHSLAIKQVTNEKSENFGKEYINGTLEVATDADCLNVVTVNFTYVTPTTKTNKPNATYNALKSIIENNKTVIEVGAENATMVSINTALGVNDFYTNRDGEERLVSAKRNEGGFVSIVSKLPDKVNDFECDILINGTRLVEADSDKNIAEDYLIVKGVIFNFRNAILPVEFIVKNSGGINYFSSLEASPSNIVFTKVWGKIENQTIVTHKEEESAFGEAQVREYTRTIREWVITGTSRDPYEFNDETTITTEELKKAMADRETYLAEVKAKQEAYQASKNATTSNAGVSAAAGGFNF